MRTLRLLLAYDGTGYAGWQIQPRAATVQQAVQQAWSRVTGETACITASGRTDSGVHALGQACGVQTTSTLTCSVLTRALNATLPEDIRILRIDEAPNDFDPIRHAIGKTYRYQIQHGRIANVFLAHHYWHVKRKLDVELMRRAADTLMGTHDFASFQSVGGDRVTTVRTITRLELQPRRIDEYDELWIFVSADGFLYNMVRIIVGSLVMVGLHKKDIDWLPRVVAARDRRLAGPTAPARGLVLCHVDYAF